MTTPANTPQPAAETEERKPGSGSTAFADRRKRNIPVATIRRPLRRIPLLNARAADAARRLIDPTTCERDYSDDETEFMKAMDRYKRENRRPFPTWSEGWKCFARWVTGGRRGTDRTARSWVGNYSGSRSPGNSRWLRLRQRHHPQADSSGKAVQQ